MKVFSIFSNFSFSLEFNIILFSIFLNMGSGCPNLINFILVIFLKFFSLSMFFFITVSSVFSFTMSISLYFFIISYPKLWNVLTLIYIFSFFNFSSKFFAASLVNEIHNISSGSISSFIIFLILAIMVNVFPLPAPATTKRFFALELITFFWYLSNFLLPTFITIEKHLLYKIYWKFLLFPFYCQKKIIFIFDYLFKMLLFVFLLSVFLSWCNYRIHFYSFRFCKFCTVTLSDWHNIYIVVISFTIWNI